MLQRDLHLLLMPVFAAGLLNTICLFKLTLTSRTPLENCVAAAKVGDFTTVKEIFASGTQGPEVSIMLSHVLGSIVSLGGRTLAANSVLCSGNALPC